MRGYFKCFKYTTPKGLYWWLLSHSSSATTSCTAPALSSSRSTCLWPLFIVRVFLRWLLYCITKTRRLRKIGWCDQSTVFNSCVTVSQSSWCASTTCKSVWCPTTKSLIWYTNNRICLILVKKWNDRNLVFIFLLCSSSILWWWIKSHVFCRCYICWSSSWILLSWGSPWSFTSFLRRPSSCTWSRSNDSSLTFCFRFSSTKWRRHQMLSFTKFSRVLSRWKIYLLLLARNLIIYYLDSILFLTYRCHLKLWQFVASACI